MGVLDELRAELAQLQGAGLTRSLREITSRQGPEITLDGRRVLNACSNDYLGLAAHPRVIDAAREATEKWGVGAGAARLIAGNFEAHESLVAALDAFTGTKTLLFSSGWHANLGTIPVIAGEGDLLVSDKLNHASLIDGCRLSRADVGVYPHGDVSSVDRALTRSRARRKIVVTESLFSMDGDLAPLADLHDVCTKHDAFLYVDEAHAYGVLGPEGKGACAAAGIRADDPNVIRMGTLGKSFGSYGAFIAAAPEIVSLLTSRSRGFIFTTGTPPAAAAAAQAALEVSLAEPQRRQGLLHRAAALRAVLAAQGWETGASAAQIVPLLIGDAELTMSASQSLLEAGVYCQGIRPPTVPQGTCRLRVSLTAAHGEAHLTALCHALGDLSTLREEAARRARG